LLTSSGIPQQLVALSRDEFTRLPTTTTSASISSYFVDKQLTQLAVSFFNIPDSTTAANGSVKLLCRTSATNVTVTGDTVGFPPEWYIALRWALADELAAGQPIEVQNRCAQRAGAYREAL